MVHVFILRTRDLNTRAENRLERCFETNDFYLTHIEVDEERKQVATCLRVCPAEEPCLIIRDTSVSASDGVASKVLKIIDQTNLEFDLCYLCKWMDRCDLYRDYQPLGESDNLVVTSNPHGVQALLISPKGAAILRGEKNMADGQRFNLTAPGNLGEQLARCIFEGRIDALCTAPNLFEFNVQEATTNEDFRKLQECQTPPLRQIQSQNQSRVWSYIIIFLIILLIGICIFYVIYWK